MNLQIGRAGIQKEFHSFAIDSTGNLPEGCLADLNDWNTTSRSGVGTAELVCGYPKGN